MARYPTLLRELEQSPDESWPTFRWWRPRQGWELVSRCYRPAPEEPPHAEEEPCRFFVPLPNQCRHRLRFDATSTELEEADEWYDPAAANPALFREAVEASLSEEELLAFTEAWGWLRGSPVHFFPAHLIPERLDGERFNGELVGFDLEELARELLHLRRAVEIWDAVDARDLGALSMWMTPAGPDAVFVRSTPRIPDGSTIPPLGEEHLSPARKALQRTVNEHLQAACSPALIDHSDSGLQLQLVPHDLLGFVWLQFAEAISGRKRYRRCAACGRWMELSPEVGRPDKIYCSDACRMRAYRRRKLADHGTVSGKSGEQNQADTAARKPAANRRRKGDRG